MIEFTCKNCGEMFSTNDGNAGKTTACPKCKASVTVPAGLGGTPRPDFPMPRLPSVLARFTTEEQDPAIVERVY